ncbi:MAG: Ig-like domain-containing protein, partial [Bacteroidales bacterium]
DKIKGFSFNGTNMFNINLNDNLVALAEKYTKKYEESLLLVDKSDALYFANQLRSDLKTSFISRINGATSPELTAITINGATSDIIGNTIQLSVAYTPSNTTQTGVTWSSSNPAIATVDNSGLVTAIAEGSVTITATSSVNGSISNTHSIVISSSVIALTALTISGSSAVNVGSTIQLSVAYTPSNTTQTGVTWSSSDETKATVNSSGLVTATAEGSVTITATSSVNGAISDTHDITISEVVQTYPEVNIMGQDSLLGFKEIYEGKIYQVCNTGGAENTAQTKTLYDTNTDTILSGWNIMDNTQKVAAFGSAGDSWLNVDNANYNGVSYLRTYRYGGGYQAIKNCYYGLNLPNGTYRVTIMQSVTNRAADANWGNLPNMGQLLINNTAYNMPNIHPNNNTQWGSPQDYIVTDGKLLFKFITNSGKYFGFSCINIKKIA